MRKYKNCETQELQQAVCNMCGKNMKVNKGRLEEGAFHAEMPWGYFSEKDGEIHSLDLCEACYDKWIKSFAVEVTVKKNRELI